MTPTRGTLLPVLAAALVPFLPACSDETVSGPDLVEETSRENPARVNQTVEVTAGGTYGEPGTIRLTLLATVAGDAAADTVAAANEFNEGPDPGMEYVLARFEVQIIDVPDPSQAFEMSLLDWEALVDGVVFQPPLGVCCVDPPLDRAGFPGGSWEGWITLEVPAGDEEVLAVHERGDSGEAWFALR